MKRLQVLINNEWDYVFCTKEGVLLPIITKSKNKSIADRFGNGKYMLKYFENKYASLEFRIV